MPVKKANPLLKWWQAASPDAKKNLARVLGRTREALHQLVHAYRNDGDVNLSPENARAVEQALDGLIPREKLCKACKACDLAKAARKAGE